MKLEHHFVAKCFSVNGMFVHMLKKNELVPSKCTVKNFMKAVHEQAIGPDNKLSNGDYRWDTNGYVGDAFELLCEAVIKMMGMHPSIGIVSYVPHPKTMDNGVDGVGKSIGDLGTVTVQCKYRADKHHLTADKDRLDSFFTESCMPPFCIVNKWNDSGELIGIRRMIVMTTAEDMHDYTKNEKFQGAMRGIYGKFFNDNIDGNLAFWTAFRNALLTI